MRFESNKEGCVVIPIFLVRMCLAVHLCPKSEDYKFTTLLTYPNAKPIKDYATATYKPTYIPKQKDKTKEICQQLTSTTIVKLNKVPIHNPKNKNKK